MSTFPGVAAVSCITGQVMQMQRRYMAASVDRPSGRVGLLPSPLGL
ncbi:MAG TPA: hypothetical protein VEK76_04500 [Candidatus Binatia bacterium]|nr:hypothetical protein [Candidatus Binatia bacterium]